MRKYLFLAKFHDISMSLIRNWEITAGSLLLRVNLSQTIFLLKPSYTPMDGEAVWEFQFIILILVPAVVRTH